MFIAAIRRTLIALAIALLASLFGPSLVHAQEIIAPTAKRASFASADLRIAFTPPAAWVRKETGLLPGTVAAYIGPVAEKFAANINLRTAAFAGDALPKDLPEQLLPLLRRDVPTYKIDGQLSFTVRGADAFRIDGSFTAPETQMPLRNRQVFVARDNRLYVFTFTASAGTFAESVAVFDRMIQSIAWTSKAP